MKTLITYRVGVKSIILLTIAPYSIVLLLYVGIGNEKFALSDFSWVLAFQILYAFLFFKSIFFTKHGFEVVKLINPIRHRVSFEFKDIEKIVVRAVGLKGGIDHIEIFLKNGHQQGIVFAMIKSDMKRLVAILNSYDVRVVDFI